MKVSLVISTYNWKEALCLCLLSVTRQDCNTHRSYNS